MQGDEEEVYVEGLTLIRKNTGKPAADIEDNHVIPDVTKVKCFPQADQTFCRLHRRGELAKEFYTFPGWLRIHGKPPYTCTVQSQSIVTKNRRVNSNVVVMARGPTPWIQGYRIECRRQR